MRRHRRTFLDRLLEIWQRLQPLDRGLDGDRLRPGLPPQPDLDRLAYLAAEGFDLVIGFAVHRQNLVADEDAGAVGRRAVIDIADEAGAVLRPRDHADAGIADLALGREQP